MKSAAKDIVGIFLFSLILCGPAVGGEVPFPWKTYQEMREHVGKLYQEKKYAEAASVLEMALDKFPDRIKANVYNLALMRTHMGQAEKAVDVLRVGLAKGLWYGKYEFFADVWKPLKELEGFKDIERTSEARRLEAQKSVKPRLDVSVPEGPVHGEKYPLFIALHGGGENVDVFKPEWTSESLKKEFVVAYPQSTQLIAPDGYNWTEDIALSLREIREVYDKVIRAHPIDTARVIVGGFSSGGVAALDVVLNETFPVAGFVVLCPAKPDDFSPEKVASARRRGVRGTLITTERDGRLSAQKEMAEIMKAEGVLDEFIINPDLGHWYPGDLGKKIDAAVVRILDDEELARGGNSMDVKIERITCLAQDGVEIVYSAAGAGEPALVFIHGGLADRTFWDAELRAFAARHRTIALDLAGHGESGSNRKTWGMPEFGADVKAVIDAEKVKKVILFGNSLGGPVAVEAALLLPGRVLGVVGVDTFQILDEHDSPDEIRARAESFYRDYSGSLKTMVRMLFHPDADPALVAEAEKRMGGTSPEAARNILMSLAGYNPATSVRRLTAPLKAINGDLYPTDISGNRKVKADFDAVIMKHMGHYPMLERPDEFNRLVAEVVAGLIK